jgi:AraC-like DNA-binding protein
MCYCRGRSYLAKGDFMQASLWIDSLVYFSRQDRYNPVKHIRQSYLLRADYYTALGDARQAKIYSDSLVADYRRSEELNTSQHIARAQAEYSQEKITAQSERLQVHRRRIIFISLVAVCGFAAAFVIFSLYRRKNAACKVLAQKARQWALENEPSLPHEPAAGTETEADGEKETPTAEDKRIMSLVQEEMSVRYAFREPGLTAETLADRLGIHRNTLSRAINRTTGGNFNLYVNSLRIKEAIRIMEGKHHKDLRIEDIYEGAGFGNRTSFFCIFKQFTGLSPLEYLNKG